MKRTAPSPTHHRWQATYLQDGVHGQIVVSAASKADAIQEVWRVRAGCGIETVHQLTAPASGQTASHEASGKLKPATPAAKPPQPPAAPLDTAAPPAQGAKRKRRG